MQTSTASLKIPTISGAGFRLAATLFDNARSDSIRLLLPIEEVIKRELREIEAELDERYFLADSDSERISFEEEVKALFAARTILYRSLLIAE